MNTFYKTALFTALALAPLAARAELVWTQGEGWVIKGGLLADLGVELNTPEKRQTALQKMNDAKRLQDAGSYGSAIDIYDGVIDDYPGSEFAAEAYFQRGIAHFQRNQFERSYTDYETLFRHHPEFPKFDTAVEQEYNLATAVKNGERPYLWGWLPWFKDRAKGLDMFESVNTNAPYGRYAEQALYNKGLLALDLEKPDAAIDAFERVINRYPDSKLVPDSYLALARTYETNVLGGEWDLASTKTALNYYNDFVSLFPKHEQAPEAVKKADQMRETLAQNRLDLGKFYYERRNNSRAAAIFFNEALNVAPDTETAKIAQEYLDKIRAGKKAARTPVDWLLGRYPETTSGDYVDAQSQANLDKMGFLTDKANAKDNTLGVEDYNNDDI